MQRLGFFICKRGMTMKKLRVCKPALAASTAFLMISSIVSMAASASGTNEIKLRLDKTSANVGDTINLTASIAPDKTGVAGFTLNVHFDPKDVSLYIPTEDELNSTYSIQSGFTVITNYDAQDSVVKIVGANMTGSNVTAESDVALASFTVLDSGDGKADFWVDVETLITESGEDYVSAQYTAPTQTKPVAASVVGASGEDAQEKTLKEEVDEIREQTGDTQTTETDEKKNYVVSSPDAETHAAETADKINYVVDTTDSTAQTDATVPVGDQTQPAAQDQAVDQTAVDQTQAAADQTQPAAQAPVNMNEAAQALFSYVAGAAGFNSEEVVQYSFKLSDSITNYDTTYDINVNIDTDGTAGGAIGAMRGSEWDSTISNTQNGTTWTYSNVDPNNTSDEVFVQLYSLSANSTFEIESIDIIDTQTYETAAHITTGGVSSVASTAEQLEAAGIVSKTEVVANEPATKAVDADAQAQTDDTTVAVETEQTTTEAQPDADVEPETAAAPVIANSESAAETEAKVAEMESSAASTDTDKPVQANKTNPNTGLSVAFKVLSVLALGEILFSLFIVFYNRYIYKDDEK